MLKNYFKVAIRSMMRNKIYSLINILGLSIGIACCLLLALYVQEEYKVDRHHTRVEDLYRITTTFQNDDNIRESATCSPPIAMAMKDEIPEVEVAARLMNPPGTTQNLIKYETNMFYESDGFIADSTIFSVLSYDFIEGNPDKALTHPNSVVLTEPLAKKIFGNESAINKIISISQGGPTADFNVTAVVREKGKSHRNPHFFTSLVGGGWADYMKEPSLANEWAGQNFVPSYLKLVPGHNKDEVIRKMNEVLIKHGSEDMKALGMKKTLSLEPVQKIYLYSTIDNRSPRITYIYVICAIAIFVLLIACINFMNLSTAKAAKRAGEIGIRKAMGAFRSSLVNQILGEAMLIVGISILISVGIVQLALPMFNQLTGKTVSFGSENMLYFGSALAAITIITGLLAGSYPAFYLSSFKPAEVLKGKTRLGNSSGFLRQALVVFQFIIGITLICGMLIINKQLTFMNNKHLGFNPDAKIVIPQRTVTAQRNTQALQKELAQLAAVEAVSGTNYVPGSPIFSDFRIYKRGEKMEDGVLHRINYVDFGYLEMMDIKVIAGRSFAEVEDSTNHIIINRAGADALGLTPEEVIGEELAMDWQGMHFTFIVIGVMENYHQTSLKEKIIPTAFFKRSPTQALENIVAKLSTSDITGTLSIIEEKWKNLNPETPFEFTFLDERFQKQYTEDIQVARIITVFTVIAIVISCLGLYGLSTYMAEQRFKEIGVRKALGADVSQIVTLMSKEFVRLILIAFAISVPLGLYVMNRWLTNFEYKTSIDALIFIYAGMAAMLIALITVSFESIKAASTNPVKALRTE